VSFTLLLTSRARWGVLVERLPGGLLELAGLLRHPLQDLAHLRVRAQSGEHAGATQLGFRDRLRCGDDTGADLAQSTYRLPLRRRLRAPERAAHLLREVLAHQPVVQGGWDVPVSDQALDHALAVLPLDRVQVAAQPRVAGVLQRVEQVVADNVVDQERGPRTEDEGTPDR
jgi:hypothetical protein